MPSSGPSLLQQAPAQRLLTREADVLAAAIGRQPWQRGLFVGVAVMPSRLRSRLVHAVSLDLAGNRLQGDLLARSDEALPFIDEAFPLVVLSHVLEWVAHADDLLREAVRVLESGGTLAVSGFEPFSAWSPWLLCRRSPRPMLTAPGWLQQRLRAHGVETRQVMRCGAALPGMTGAGGETWLGGGFVLLAIRRRAAVTMLRTRQPRRYAGASAPWLSNTHRECA